MNIDAYDDPDALQLLRAREERLAKPVSERRELRTTVVRAAAFLVAATVLAILAPWQRPLSVSSLGLVLLVWVAMERVRFPVASYWTTPTLLAFIPALFVLPTPLVPLVGMTGVIIADLPALIRGRVAPRMILTQVGDSWFTIGPALVIVLAGVQRFAWIHWPVYLGALLAQFLFDFVATVAMAWWGEKRRPGRQLPILLCWAFLVDAALAPLGLIIASVSEQRPVLVLISLSQAALLIFFARERQQRLEQVQALSTAYRGTALLLGDVVEADDHYTGSHSRDVVDLSLAVADQMRLDSKRRRDVEFAALLHDVGKIHVPKDIINKRGPLDESEWAVIRRHTIDGELMLRKVGGTLSNVGRIVRSSHERFDGRGYPDGLAGDDIPLEARIVSVCDSFSAMTTNRPYRHALSVAQAVAELRSCAGSQFDPHVVYALANMVGGAERPVDEESSATASAQTSSVRMAAIAH